MGFIRNNIKGNLDFILHFVRNTDIIVNHFNGLSYDKLGQAHLFHPSSKP